MSINITLTNVHRDDNNNTRPPYNIKRNSKIPKGQTEIVKLEDRQYHGQQNETKDTYRTHNTTLKTA